MTPANWRPRGWPDRCVLNTSDCVVCWSCLSTNNAVAGLALVLLMMIARHPSAISFRKLRGKSFITGPGNYTAYLGSHSEVMGREREREREPAQAWGSAFIGVKGGGLRFRGFTLYW